MWCCCFLGSGDGVSGVGGGGLVGVGIRTFVDGEGLEVAFAASGRWGGAAA